MRPYLYFRLSAFWLPLCLFSCLFSQTPAQDTQQTSQAVIASNGSETTQIPASDYVPASNYVPPSDPAEGIAFFEQQIRPLLAEHCYECHSASSKPLQGGLRLDTPGHIRTGGDSGPALVSSKPDESMLIQVVRYKDPNSAMPPKGKLPDAFIAKLEQWIQRGAPMPSESQTAAVQAYETLASKSDRLMEPTAAKLSMSLTCEMPRSRSEATRISWVRQFRDASYLSWHARKERPRHGTPGAAGWIWLFRSLRIPKTSSLASSSIVFGGITSVVDWSRHQATSGDKANGQPTPNFWTI